MLDKTYIFKSTIVALMAKNDDNTINAVPYMCLNKINDVSALTFTTAVFVHP